MTETLLQHPRVTEYAPWFPAALKSGRDASPEAAGQQIWTVWAQYRSRYLENPDSSP
jgi:hypothetical protein